MEQFSPEKYWPLGSTVQNTSFSSATDMYRHFGLISANPLTGHMVIIYRRGVQHVGDYGSICIRHSTDGGITWGNEYEIYSESANNRDIRFGGGGYDSNGRLFVFFSTYDPNNSCWVAMKYIYSDDDGNTWTVGDDNLDHEISPETNTIFNPYGHIIDVGNNTLYQTWFGGIPVQNSPSIYRMYLYKSTDGGASFTEVIPINDTRQPWGEPSMVNLGGGCFLILARMNDQIGKYKQFKSVDNCESWSAESNPADFSETTSYGAPPFLSFINYEGVGIVACYYTNRTKTKLKVVFGLAKDLLENGIDGWNLNTKVEIYDYPDGIIMSGYQSFFLPLNQYKGIGVCFKETVSNSIAYPVIVFTKITGMHNVLTTLGL